MEQWKSYKNVKGKAQAGETPVRPNTDALYELGLSHSSEESPVMGVERRWGYTVEVTTDNPKRGEG